MRVLFVYPGRIDRGEQPLGLMYLSGFLKQHGHETRLFRLRPEEDGNFNYHMPRIRERFSEELTSFNPGLIGFSVIVTVFSRAKTLAKWAKDQSNAKLVFGGANPTVEPERTLVESEADFVCVGEGEHALLDLVIALEQNRATTGIPNIWAKVDGRIYRNDVRQLVEDLDMLPWPDRELIRENFQSGDIEWASFISARGCPYQCTYCHNPYLQELYDGKGRYVRFRDVHATIAEIKNVKSRFGVSRVTFSDDTFTLNKERILQFCQIYAKEVTLPFQCQSRPNALDKEVCLALKAAGCESVHIGLEAGNDRLRNEVLKRNLSREQILSALSEARDAGLRTATFNMVGVPFETEQTIWETIRLNRIARPDVLCHTIFMPLTGSKAKQICEEKGWPMKGIDASYYHAVFLEQPSISPPKLLAYQKLFDLYVYAPKFLHPLIHALRILWEHFPETRKLHQRVHRTVVFQATEFLRRRYLTEQ